MGILRSVLTEKKTPPEKADVSECRGFPSLSKYYEMRKREVLDGDKILTQRSRVAYCAHQTNQTAIIPEK